MRFVPFFILAVIFGLLIGGCASTEHAEQDWESLFDGNSLQGWSAGPNNETFSVEFIFILSFRITAGRDTGTKCKSIIHTIRMI